MDRDDELPRIRASASGRVPQWVMDEAVGKPAQVVPFRGPTSRRAKERRRRRGRGALVLLTVVMAVGTVALTLDGPGSGTAALRREVSGRSDVPPAGKGEAAAPLGRPPAVPARAEGDGYRFLEHQHASSTPVTWSPCRAVHYVVRPDNAPPGGSAVLREAVAAVSAATGLRFVDDGATTEAPREDREPYQPDRYGKRWAPVLVTWATRAEVPDFGVDIAGEAGPQPMESSTGVRAYVTGTVALDPAYLGRAPRAVAVEVVEHELGHLVGLAHVDDRAELMYPRAGEATGYGPGDRAGLARLGSGPCHKDL
ncbi:MAG: hypothetical protein ACXVGH_03335 [Mycobacteriales bacterium]